MYQRLKLAAQIVLLIASVILLVVGILLGEMEAVLSKAVNLCLECVGIG